MISSAAGLDIDNLSDWLNIHIIRANQGHEYLQC
jgi:hypothetical protein